MIVRLAARRIASKPRWTAAQQRALATDAPPAPEPLSGSVGEHARHLVLFTGRSFDTIPSHIDTVSPLYRRIVARMKDPESPLSRYALAVTDSSALKTEKSALAWQQEANRFDLPDRSERGDEAYGGVIYPDGVEIPFALTEDAVATKQLDNFCGTLSSPAGLHNPGLGAPRFAANGEIDVFVCTHGARDCRCGDVGSAFYDSLLQEARRRKLGHAAKVFKEGSGPVRIHRVTHIGGHRFAATCFTSTGDWYGLLSPSDASNFLQYLDKQRTATRDDLGAIWWSKWRGRAGLSQDAQLALAEQGASYMQEQGGNTSASATDLAKSLKKQRKDRRKPLGDAVDVPYLTYEGEELKIRAFRGETLMDAAKRRDLVEATCGGACECATCHVHLRPADHGKPAPVPEVTDEEDDQLEYAMFADDDSRLACQIEITEDLVSWLEKQGGRVQLPRY